MVKAAQPAVWRDVRARYARELEREPARTICCSALPASPSMPHAMRTTTRGGPQGLARSSRRTLGRFPAGLIARHVNGNPHLLVADPA